MKLLKANYVKSSNFGDCVFPYMLESSEIPHKWVSHNEECKVISTGSILGIGAKKDTLVWGSGVININTSVNLKAIFLLVRGKYSAKAVEQDVPLGDPAIALCEYYKPLSTKKVHKIGIIPHQIHFDKVKKEITEKGLDYYIIDPTTNTKNSFERYIEEVNSCEKIISTTLHGTIAAHSYGVPAIPYHYDDALTGDGTKFLDYYSVWKEFQKATSVLEEGPVQLLAESENFWTPNESERNAVIDIILETSPLNNRAILDSRYFLT